MDIWRGTWLHLPFGNKSIYDMTEEDDSLMLAAEYAAKTVRVWNTPIESRSQSDILFISWVNKK